MRPPGQDRLRRFLEKRQHHGRLDRVSSDDGGCCDERAKSEGGERLDSEGPLLREGERYFQRLLGSPEECGWKEDFVDGCAWEQSLRGRSVQSVWTQDRLQRR